MITQLSIKNFGLIDQVSLDFHENLNILTGETGAGKSILIDALRGVLGERISTSLIRDSQKPSILQATFDLSKTEVQKLEILEDFIEDDDPSLIVHRTITPDGRNKIKINGTNVTVGQLREIGNHIIDFHGPHDHQMLLSSNEHLGMLDRLVDFEELFGEYSQRFNSLNIIQKKLNDLRALASSRDRELDLLSHQVHELAQVSLEEKDYEDLKQEQARIDNAERLSESIQTILISLEGDGNSSGTSEMIQQIFSPMRKLNQIDESTEPLMELLDQFQNVNEQMVESIRDYGERLAFDPQRANEVSNLYDIYDGILRKYGPTLEDAKKFHAQAKEKHDLLNDLEHNDADLSKELEKIKKELLKIAQKMTVKRQKAADALKGTIEAELKELGINHVQFEARIESVDFHRAGNDQVTFYISPNAGEDLKPLADIVSSGEAARVMLALKKALINVDPIPVLIFDEIDAQIGGRLGTITGKKLREISRKRQVILITHLPQIASFADIHFKVTKNVHDNRSITNVNALDKKSRIEELAQMMSGETESKIAIKHANDMFNQANV